MLKRTVTSVVEIYRNSLQTNQFQITPTQTDSYYLDVYNYISYICSNFDDVNEFYINTLSLDDVVEQLMITGPLEKNKIYEFCSLYDNLKNSNEPFILMTYPTLKTLEYTLDRSKFSRLQLHKSFMAFQQQYNMLLLSSYANKYILRKNVNSRLLIASKKITEILVETKTWLNSSYKFDKHKLFVIEEILTYIYFKFVHCNLAIKKFEIDINEIKNYISDTSNYLVTFESGLCNGADNKCIVSKVYVNRFFLEILKLLQKSIFSLRNYSNENWIINQIHSNKFKIKKIDVIPAELSTFTDFFFGDEEIQQVTEYVLNRFNYVYSNLNDDNVYEAYFLEEVSFTLFNEIVTEFYISLLKTALDKLGYLEFASFDYYFINQVASALSTFSVKPVPSQNDTLITYLSKVSVYLNNSLRILSTNETFITNVRNSVYTTSDVVKNETLQTLLLEFITSCFKENIEHSILNFISLYYDNIIYILATKLKYLEELNDHVMTSYFTSLVPVNMLSTFTNSFKSKNFDVVSMPNRLKNDYQIFKNNCYKIICGIITSIPYLIKTQNLCWKVYTKINKNVIDSDFYLIPTTQCITTESSTIVTPDMQDYYFIEGNNTQYLPTDSFFLYIRSIISNTSERCLLPMTKTGFVYKINNSIFATSVNENSKLKDFFDLNNLLANKFIYKLSFTRSSSLLLLDSFISSISHIMSLDEIRFESSLQPKHTYIKINYNLASKINGSTSFIDLIENLSMFVQTTQTDTYTDDLIVVETNVTDYFQIVNTDYLIDISYNIPESYKILNMFFSLQEEKYLLSDSGNPIEKLIITSTILPFDIVQSVEVDLFLNIINYNLISHQSLMLISDTLLGTTFTTNTTTDTYQLIEECNSYIIEFVLNPLSDANVKDNLVKEVINVSQVTNVILQNISLNFHSNALSKESVDRIYQVLFTLTDETLPLSVDEKISQLINEILSGSVDSDKINELIQTASNEVTENNLIDNLPQIAFLENVEEKFSSSLSSEVKSFSNDINTMINSMNAPEDVKEEIKKTILDMIPNSELSETKEREANQEILVNELSKMVTPFVQTKEVTSNMTNSNILDDIVSNKNGILSSYNSSVTSSIYSSKAGRSLGYTEKGLFSNLSKKLSKPTGFEKAISKVSRKLDNKIQSIYNFGDKTLGNIISILTNNPVMKGIDSALGFISTLQGGATKLFGLITKGIGMFKNALDTIKNKINSIKDFMKKIGSLFKKFTSTNKQKNPSTKISRYDIEFETPQIKTVMPTIQDNCIFGFVEPPLVLFEGMENIQDQINAIIYTNEVFLTLKPGMIKKVDNAPFFVFQITKTKETISLIQKIMNRLGFGINTNSTCSSVSQDGFVFMLSSYSINHAHSNNESTSFINRFANLLTDTNRQWSVLFNKTKDIYNVTEKALSTTESVGSNVSSSFIGDIASFITPDKIEQMVKGIGTELWDQFKSVIPGMVGGATFDSPKIVTGSSSSISIECNVLLTCDLPIPELIKERIVKPLMLLHVISTPLTMYDYLSLSGVIKEDTNDSCYSSLKYLYMMPVYIKATLQHGYKGLSDKAQLEYGLSPRKFYEIDCIITNISTRDHVYKDGYLVSVGVSFTLTPVYNVIYGSTDKQDQSSMLTLGWLAKNYEAIINQDVYNKVGNDNTMI